MWVWKLATDFDDNEEQSNNIMIMIILMMKMSLVGDSQSIDASVQLSWFMASDWLQHSSDVALGDASIIVKAPKYINKPEQNRDQSKSYIYTYIFLLLIVVIRYACAQRAIIDHFGHFQTTWTQTAFCWNFKNKLKQNYQTFHCSNHFYLHLAR